MTVDNANVVQPCRLLVLDDEQDVGQTIVNMARSAGIEARAVSSASDFFAGLEAFSPTHVAVDLMMPSLDGIAVIRLLAETYADIPIVIISGASPRVLEAARRSAAEHGLIVAGVLGKPFSRRALVAALQLQQGGVAPRASSHHGTAASLDLESQVANALATDAIGIALQPKVALSNGALIGFEVLARWTNDLGEAVPPDQFVAAAVRAGLIDDLTEAVLGKAMAWLAATHRDRGLSVAVNVSARSLHSDRFLTMIDTMCQLHGVLPERLIVELTESEAAGDQTDTLDTLTQLRLRKIDLAIDDFGVGYSSLVQLAQLPFSELKIDRRFVSDLSVSHESHAIVAAIIGMAKGLGVRTVAEGVEDLETFNLIKAMGCDYAQGYFIGRPMSPDKATNWIDA